MNTFIYLLVSHYFNQLNEKLSRYIPNRNISDLMNTYLEEDEEQDDIEGEDLKSNSSELDNIHSGKGFSNGSLLQTNTPIIYAFITKYAPNAIKIGYTVQGAEQRVDLWKKYYPDANLIGYWTATEVNQAALKVYFMDFSVHNRVKGRGYTNLKDNPEDLNLFKQLAKEDQGIEDIHVSSEFFMKYKDMNIKDTTDELNEQIIEDIITEIKSDIRNGIDVGKLYTIDKNESVEKTWGNPADYNETPLQQDAINNAINAIKNEGATDLLMAAVMRFGKTHTTYQIIKQSGIKYAIITSAKADTRAAWRDDINHVNYIDDFVFIEFNGNYSLYVTEKNEKTGKLISHNVLAKDAIQYYRDLGKTVIVFATLQDLSGKHERIKDSKNGFDDEVRIDRTIKMKHEYLFNPDNKPDMVVIDETHYGSHSKTYGKAVGLSSNEITPLELKEAKEEAKECEEITSKIRSLDPKYTLQCSGTPYYILASGEFSDIYKNKTIISNVSFTDMLAARNKWVEEHKGEDESKSPYFGIPNIIRFGMNLTTKCRNAIKKADNIDSALSELFKNDNHVFEHESAIKELMESIFGANNHEMPGFLDEERIKNGEIFKHIIMVLPHINDCHLLKELLIKYNIVDTDERKIIVAVERRTKLSDTGLKMDPEAKDSTLLNQALNGLENNGKHSLTLTVNRFLTGVSVPLWDAMFYMKDTKSPLEYDLAIFRLCTRNVATVSDKDGNKAKICRKSNVYLIDFKIDRMYNMMINSAIALCSAKGKTSAKDVSAVIELNIKNMPTYSESIWDKSGLNILDKMHELNPDDLLKLYVNYNKNRSIEDSIDLNLFGSFINNVDNLRFLQHFSEGLLNQGTKLTQQEGEDTIADLEDLPEGSGNDELIPLNLEKGVVTKNGKPKKDKRIETLQKKFANMLKSILYCCICLPDVPKDIDDFIKICSHDEESELICKDFNIDIDDVYYSAKLFNASEKMLLNMLIYQIGQLLVDKSIEPLERVLNAISKLGLIDKNEVVTPAKLAKKMVDKLSDDVRGKSILEVNSKYGEFLILIYKRWGKEAANNVKVVASSEMTKNFIKKVLNILELDEYNLVDILDFNGNGKYDIKDFLEAPNEKILEFNLGMKFDCIVSNAPYDNGLHEKFEAKYFEICLGEIVWVSPLSFLLGKRQNKRICGELDKYTCDIELINGNEYFDAAIGGTMGITYVDMSTNHNTGSITFDGKTYNKCNEITSFSSDNLLIDFKSIIEPLAKKDNLDNHIEATNTVFNKSYIVKNPINNPYIIIMLRYSGHSNARSKEIGEFYTIYSLHRKFNEMSGYFDDLLKLTTKSNTPFLRFYVNCKNKHNSYNFWKYCHTLFFSTILYLYKTTLDLISGRPLSFVPWFDFSDPLFNGTPEEIDIALFKKYHINQEIINHIITDLPNYYNLDLSKYKKVEK